MPFDGGEFSQASGPLPPNPAPMAPRPPVMARLRGLFRGGAGSHEARSPFPGQAGHPFEAPAVHLPREARALIETEEAWSQGAYRALDGKRCAVGALRAAAREAGWRGFRAKGEAHAFLLAVAKERGFGGVGLMDDRSTHARVLAAFDAAIARAG